MHYMKCIEKFGKFECPDRETAQDSSFVKNLHSANLSNVVPFLKHCVGDLLLADRVKLVQSVLDLSVQGSSQRISDLVKFRGSLCTICKHIQGASAKT